jgi:hypothetical protein
MMEHLSRSTQAALARADNNRADQQSKLAQHVLATIMRELGRLKPDNASKVLLEAARQHRQRMESDEG